MTLQLNVTAGAGYAVIVDTDCWQTLPTHLQQIGLRGRIHIVADQHLAEVATQLQAACGATTTLLLLPGGESTKEYATLMRIYDHLLSARVERRDVLVALGGGVIGDVAGFAAATTLRGIACVQMPTTLLAMVDSAVGGKTGINHPLGKNMIGAFHQPRLVLADVSLLKTLPQRELAAGWAEAIKHGVIRDAQLFVDLEQADPTQAFFDADLVRRAVAVKVEVVNIDEREQAERMLLNYGHTVGHAIEQLLGYGTLLHGEAIAIGMHIEAQLAVALGLCDADLVRRQQQMLQRYGLPIALPAHLTADDLLAVMQRDKKVDAGQIRWALPRRIGHAEIIRDVSLDTVRAVVSMRGAS
ncbi:MAG: 3-dehydroquinate synthase [Chloroflexota bacterium]